MFLKIQPTRVLWLHAVEMLTHVSRAADKSCFSQQSKSDLTFSSRSSKSDWNTGKRVPPKCPANLKESMKLNQIKFKELNLTSTKCNIVLLDQYVEYLMIFYLILLLTEITDNIHSEKLFRKWKQIILENCILDFYFKLQCLILSFFVADCEMH